MSNQDGYLYIQMMSDYGLYRVDISKLVCEKSRPPLERPQKYEGDRNGRFEIRKMFKNSVTNTVLQLETLIYNRGTTFSWKVTSTIDSKIFVLVCPQKTPLVHGYVNGWEDGIISRSVFQVYDPFHGSWKILPNPPISDTQSDYLFEHFEWGHMLGVFDRRCRGPSYVFDTIEEKWMPAVGLPHLECAVELSGFLIGMELRDRNSRSIVAYKLDDEVGLPDPNSKHTLDNEVWEIFYPPLKANHEPAFLTRFGDDQVIFLSTATNLRGSTFIVVAVFRVSISTVCGLPVVNAHFEQKQLYELAGVSSAISSNFLMQDAPSYGTHRILIKSLPPIMLDDQPLYLLPNDNDRHHAPLHEQIDNIAAPSEAEKFENKLMADVEWDAGLMEKSMYLCFVENRTDCSVSYIIKAIKFSDLISTSSHDSNSKLHQVASTSGFHLACLPCCGVFGSQILFAGGSDQDDLRVVQHFHDDCFSEQEYLTEEVVQQVPNSRNIHFYDVASNDPRCNGNIKRFTKFFKGMKPQPVLAEVEGKLYALAGTPKAKYINPGPFFEVFDPVEKEWSPLPDPPLYTKFGSFSNCSHAIAGSKILAWGNESPGVFWFDMAADSIDRDWRLIKNSRAFGVEYHRKYDHDHHSTIVVNSSSDGGDFVLFTHKHDLYGSSSDLQIHLISREFDYVASLPSLKLPQHVSSFLKAQSCGTGGYSSFAHLGGRRVCMVLSCSFRGPYSRNVYRLGEVEKMSIVILVFEFEVTEDRKSVAAKFVFHRMLEYDTNSHATRNSKTSDAHMVGAFLL